MTDIGTTSRIKIPRYHYDRQFPDLEALIGRIRQALRSGDYILGSTVEHFEERFASYVGTRHAVGVNSGTDALTMAFQALGIGPGDEVITVANTFHASVLAITEAGARPVLVDCTPDDYLIDLDQVEAAIGPRTRALLVVHLFGKAVDMDRVRVLADRHGLAVVEDCAQAVGARWNGRRVGALGTVGCFSFHPSKNLAAAGDAGAVTTDVPELAARIQVLRALGQRAQNDHVTRGHNSKLDVLQALVLDHKLDALDAWNAHRRTVAERYAARLAALGLTGARPAGDRHVFHLYQVAVPHRDRVLTGLRAGGVDAVIRYPVPIHRQPAFADLGLTGAFPHAERQASDTLCLPIRPDLTDHEIDYVVDAVAALAGPARP
ncbi:DegT/DnrJ/EryC1/StrS family aminotransferase [Embleya sp. AB8]|uniref:DegT/DnrJ/EryC1/StrS family aminotransferase n=1 Tax=Embleya sp. AB8 TaxID=3156304 RepID=UPI003C76DDA4